MAATGIWKSRWTVLAVVAMGATLTWGDDAATQPASRPTADVTALVRDLDNDQFAIRESAEKKLIDMGDDVELQLREILRGNLSAESRSQIVAAIHGIDENRPYRTSYITMHPDNAPMLEMLKDFAAQAHADLGTDDPALVDYCRMRTVSFDLDHVDFWDAVRKVSDQTNLRPASIDDGTGMHLMADASKNLPPWFRGSGETCGPFLVVPISCSRIRDSSVHFGQPAPAAHYALSLELNVAAEPKLHLASIDTSGWVKECTDDKGRSLLPDQIATNTNGIPWDQQWWWPLQSALRDYPDPGTKIAILKGEIRCGVTTRRETIDVDDLSKPLDLTRTINGVEVTVMDSAQVNGQWQLRLTATGNFKGDGFQIVNTLTSNIEISDEQGKLFIHAGGGGSESMGMLTRTLLLNPPAAGSVPRKFHWDVPAGIRQIVVPFELHDLALPPLR